MRDQNTRAMLIEAVIAGGLMAIGMPTGQPLLVLAAAATSVGCNWTHSLAERGFQHWRERWFTDDGVLNHDISRALCHAFVDAVRQVEHDWKEHRYYQYLRHKRPEAAQLTLDAFRLLREDATTLFQQPHQLAQVALQEPQERVLSLLDQNKFKANEYLKPVLVAFLYGHDDEFVTFVAEQFGPHWILRFVEILKDPGEEGTRAWRACQLLWQKSLVLGIDQIQQTTTETADTVRWLQEWAWQLKSLPLTQRDPIGQDALEEILHSVQAQLDEMQKTLDKTYATTLDIKATVEQVYQKVVPATPAPSHIWNVPYQQNPFFTGRENLLKQLRDNLTNRKAVALTQAISGLGGIGKTQTAIEYAYRYRDKYPAVLWVNAATRDTLIASFLDLAHRLNLPEKDEQDQHITVQAVKRWLEHHDHWLLIVDNADDLSLAYDFLPTGGKGHIVLTTRAQALGTLARKIDVETMDTAEGMLFLLRRTKILALEAPLSKASAADRSAVETIVKEMDGLPLALDQAGAYIEETGCGLSEYLALYARHRLALLKRENSMASEYPHTVASTWTLSFTQVEQADPAAADLLRVCAFLHPDAIPEEILTEGAAALGPQLQQVATEPLLLNEAIHLLRRYSLVKRDAEAKLLSLHRLVQAVLQDAMPETEREMWRERLISAINTVFPGGKPPTWRQCERLIPHALVCAIQTQSWKHANLDLASVLFKAARYLAFRAQYTEAEPLWHRALHIREQALGPEHPDVASSLKSLADLYSEQGKYAEAEPLYQRSLHIREQALGPKDLLVASSLNGLGYLYYLQGKYAEAEPLYQRALHIEEQALGPEHPEVASSLNDLGLLYSGQGKYAEVEPLYQRALRIWEEALGPEHPDVAYPLSNLGMLYREQGKYSEAEPLYQRALYLREQALGPEHPLLAFPLNGLADLYSKQGKYAEAESLYRREAESLYQRALAICEQALGPLHPKTVDTRMRYASLLREMGRQDEAVHLEASPSQ